MAAAETVTLAESIIPFVEARYWLALLFVATETNGPDPPVASNEYQEPGKPEGE